VSRQEMVCNRCRNGRLLGEAVHDREGGWRYFLSCYGCGARTPLGADAHRELMDEPKVAAGRAAMSTDRGDGALREATPAARQATSSFADHKNTCAHPGCTTRISIYNSSTTCWAHS
jgi:hypothetical protein